METKRYLEMRITFSLLAIIALYTIIWFGLLMVDDLITNM